MKNKHATLYFNQGEFKFSAGHFTIFSETEREPLHGHNYSLEVKLTAKINEPGITFDYRILSEKLNKLCKQLNWHTLIPAQSPYLKITEDSEHFQITFNQQSMWLLKTDVVLLPLDNITLETLSQWFVDYFTHEKLFLEKHAITDFAIKVFNGPFHAAEACCL
ncbi:MAG: 6-carboxytetrahydropterin synthase [Gammaproteobacteria bacterium]|nr:6-carboxytetrahydropterin synthase [Gammaproteobacteria bacterium]